MQFTNDSFDYMIGTILIALGLMMVALAFAFDFTHVNTIRESIAYYVRSSAFLLAGFATIGFTIKHLWDNRKKANNENG